MRGYVRMEYTSNLAFEFLKKLVAFDEECKHIMKDAEKAVDEQLSTEKKRMGRC